MSGSLGNVCRSQPAICCGDHWSVSLAATARRSFRRPRQPAALRALRVSPGPPISRRSAIPPASAIARHLAADRRGRTAEPPADRPERPPLRQVPGDLFALDAAQRPLRPTPGRRRDAPLRQPPRCTRNWIPDAAPARSHAATRPAASDPRAHSFRSTTAWVDTHAPCPLRFGIVLHRPIEFTYS